MGLKQLNLKASQKNADAKIARLPKTSIMVVSFVLLPQSVIISRTAKMSIHEKTARKTNLPQVIAAMSSDI